MDLKASCFESNLINNGLDITWTVNSLFVWVGKAITCPTAVQEIFFVAHAGVAGPHQYWVK